MKVVLIVAVCKSNNGIGKDNDLLWHLPADMNFFKDTTMGFPIITGRKGYDSIPDKYRPLPNRDNIVITRDGKYQAEGAIVVHSLEKAISQAEKLNSEKCFIIGGGQIYKLALDNNLIDEMLVTWVDADLDADVFFEGFAADNWQEKTIMIKDKDAKNPYNFKIVKYTAKFTV